MKHAYFLIPLLFFVSKALGQGIAFENTDWAAVKAKAKAENKPIFVDTYAHWCEPCKWMSKNTFSQEEVGAFFAKNYISFKLDIEKGEGIEFAQNYRVTSFPTLLYFDANGELVHRIIGAFKPQELIAKSQDALDKNKQVYTLQKMFEAGERSPEFLYKYTYALQAVNEDYQRIADVYLEQVGNDALIEERNFEFLERFVNDYNHKTYLYVAANKAKFVLALGGNRVENYLDAAFKIRCYEIIENASSKIVIQDYLQDVKNILPDRVDYFKTRIDFYYNRGDERKDYRLAKKHEKHCKDAKSLNGLARYLLDIYGNSNTHLTTALEWADKALTMEENAQNLETKALILLAMNKKEAALEVAQKQLEVCKKNGSYIAETEALIEKIKN